MVSFLGSKNVNFSYNHLGSIHCFDTNELILKTENLGKYVGILIDGYVKVCLYNSDGKEILVQFMKPISFIGEVTTIIGKRFSQNLLTIATTPVKVVMVTKEDFENELKQSTEMMLFLLKAQCEKVTSLISRLHGESFQDSMTLISDILLAYSSISDEIRLSHDEIAETVGKNRVTVSKVLLKLQKYGAIEQGKKRIVIKKPDLLKQICYEQNFDLNIPIHTKQKEVE